jgi:hypothetical protein
MLIVFEELMVQYPMPAWCVPHVTRFLDDLYNGARRVTEETATQPNATNAAQPDWSVDDLRRLKPLIRHNRIAMAVLDLASEKQGQYVSFTEACARAEIEPNRGRAGIGALTKVCHKIGKEKWPVSWQWAGNGESTACYLMSEEIAKLWQTVSGE